MIPSHTTQSHPNDVDGAGINITDFTVKTDDSQAHSDQVISVSRWRTREFKFYALVFVLVVPFLVYWPIHLSSRDHPNYGLYSFRLEKGWIFGRMVDASDPQYRSFRSGLLPLVTLATIYLISSAIQSRLSTNPSNRARFIAAFSVVMLVILHGISAFKPLVILFGNYRLSKLSKSGFVGRYWPAIVIIVNMGVLFLNHVYDGYHLERVFAPLDAMNGILRWHVHFNITMLRIVSYMCDYHWREVEAKNQVPVDYKTRVRSSLPLEEYSLVNYIAYCLYPPLYIAGPIMTFNDFTWQLQNPITIPIKTKISYALRFVFCLLTMELILHTIYVVAIKDTHAWQGYSATDLSTLGFWNLVIVWLKLLIPWRFFRLWALLDGVDSPENMIRCVANNYSSIGFWKSWHRSYNLWLVRYIYIPVGGNHTPVRSTLLVFTFVALWHDLTFRLLAWGWLVSLFIVPELLARRVLPFQKYGHEPWYRHIAACGGTLNILMMMTANLVGFVLGLDGIKLLWSALTGSADGWRFLAFACFCLFVATQVMFEYREEERRMGIDRKC